MEHIHLLVSTFDTVTLRLHVTSGLAQDHPPRPRRDQDQDQDLKKVVLIGLETKTRSRDPHPWSTESKAAFTSML